MQGNRKYYSAAAEFMTSSEERGTVHIPFDKIVNGFTVVVVGNNCIVLGIEDMSLRLMRHDRGWTAERLVGQQRRWQLLSPSTEIEFHKGRVPCPHK